MNFNKKLKDDFDNQNDATPVGEELDDVGEGKKEKKKEDEEKSDFPNKKQFLDRMRYSREWLDLVEVEMGMNT